MGTASFVELLKRQMQLHASMEPQDAVKLCYQAAFGAEHLLPDLDQAKHYFVSEYTQTPAAAMLPFEQISSSYSRVNLAAWKHLGLPPEWLFSMFYHTAAEATLGGAALLQGYLDAVTVLAKEGALSFDLNSWQTYRHEYETNGGGPVHHSDAYRRREQPAYRIVQASYARLLPLLQALSRLPQSPQTTIVTIDGRAAAGKSTTAQLLASILTAGIVQMDDFFLPPELRTPQRLAEVGGNIHYERFSTEVLPFLRDPKGFSYLCFDCEQMAYGQRREIPAGVWRIVEGSYSSHPAFGAYMDLLVFCDVAPDQQLSRIISRNGKRAASVFASRWIPLEERYFAATATKQKAHVIL